MEFFELAVRSSSLLSRATETDALIVCINGVVLAMNFMLLPLTLRVASLALAYFCDAALKVLWTKCTFYFARVYITIGYYESPWLCRTSDHVSSTVQGFQKVAEQKIARNGWLRT